MFIVSACLFVVLLLHQLFLRCIAQKASVPAVASDFAQPPSIRNYLPLGLDRVEQIIRADNENRLMALFLSHFRLTGTTISHKFLWSRSLGTIEPRNLEALLKSQSHDWSLAHRAAMKPLLGNGIFTLSGSEWKRARDFLRPHLHPRHYDSLTVFREPFRALMSRVPDSGVVDLQPLLFEFSLDVASEFFLGGLLMKDQAFTKAFNSAQKQAAKLMRFPALYSIIGGRNFSSTCATVRKMIDEAIQNRGNQGTPWKFATVAQSADNAAALRDHIINMLVAGRDTTACLMSWAMYCPIPFTIRWADHVIDISYFAIRSVYRHSKMRCRLCPQQQSLAGRIWQVQSTSVTFLKKVSGLPAFCLESGNLRHSLAFIPSDRG